MVEEWSKEIIGLPTEKADEVLELIKAKYDKPPTIREIRRAVLTIRERVTGFGSRDDDQGRTSPCVHCKQPVENGPDAASRYERATETWINAHLSCRR